MNVLIFIERLARNRVQILGYFVAGVTAILSWYFVSTTFLQKKEAKLKPLATKNEIETFIGSNDVSHDRVREMKETLRTRPLLRPGNEQKVAQKLLAHGMLQEALPLIESAAKRVGGLPPYYKAYSEVSVLIAKGDLHTAYEKAKQLREQLFSDDTIWNLDHTQIAKSGALITFTLIKLSAIEQALGLQKEELSTIRSLKVFLGLGAGDDASPAIDKKTQEALIRHYKVNTSSLEEYIHQRERILRRK